mmetsp:Transcript_17755/g.40265  ORF Transcript_17755/g.40265 Transcript_17755/m.40265 type:complete len:285 (+) Transcript_17755:350-1204(+)
MRPVGRDAHSRATYWEIIWKATDFTRFPCDFHFLLGISVLLEFINVWNDIEGKGVGKYLIVGDISLAAENSSRSLLKLVHTGLSCTARSLISGHDNTLEAEQLVNWPQSHEADGGRAVGIGNKFGVLCAFTVDLGYYERNVFLVPERGRVINHDRPALSLGNSLCVFQGKIARHSEEHHVALAALVDLELFHRLDPPLPVRNVPPCRPLRSEDAELVRGEAAAPQALHNLHPDGTGGSHDPDGVSHDGGAASTPRIGAGRRCRPKAVLVRGGESEASVDAGDLL